MNLSKNNITCLIIGFGMGWIMLTCLLFNKQVQYIVQEKIIGVEYCENFGFSQENLINEIKRLDFKYPHIVLAQAQLETGNFTSKIFLSNHNLFGLKEAKQRINTAQGTKRGHAYFNTWNESLLDYAMYYCKYLSNLKTEKEYYQYLQSNYSEDSEYLNKLIKKAKENEKLF